jgi:four helix bundle protein
MPFDFEDFPVYKDAIKFIQEVDGFLESVPQKGNLRIIDQLQRASTSIVLNIAEGAGRYHKTDKRNFYVMARGSVYECVACFQILSSKKLISEEEHRAFYITLNNLAKQLSAMIR